MRNEKLYETASRITTDMPAIPNDVVYFALCIEICSYVLISFLSRREALLCIVHYA